MGVAEILYNPKPQSDRGNCPSPEEVRQSVRMDAARLLPSFVARVKAQSTLTCECPRGGFCPIHTVVKS